MRTQLAAWLGPLLAAFALALAGCDDATPTPRCATCGMIVEPTSGWRAGGRAEGADLVFDAPKCLFRYRHEHGGALEDAWVIEYYTQERRSPEGLRFVIGSDLESPMGRDLVPVEGEEAAERLRVDHHGEAALTYDQVTPAVVQALFEPR